MRNFLILLIFVSATAKAAIYNLNPIDSSFQAKLDTAVEIKNMPPLMSQDTIGICYAVASSTLLTAENCRSQKTDCAHISEKDIFSPLDLAQFGGAINGDKASPYSYEIREGGNIGNVTQRIAMDLGYSVSEDCQSLDKVLSKIGGAKEGAQIQAAVWKNLKAKYDGFKKKCPTCTADSYSTGGNDQADELSKFVKDQNLNIKKTNQEVLSAFAQDSYERFLYDLLTPAECRRTSRAAVFMNQGKVKVDFYPENGKGNYDEMMKNIKTVLGTGRPLGLGNVCLAKVVTKDCTDESHAVVIAGYRKVCNQKNECRDSLKVINSWGQSWQDKNNDGWLDAKALLDSTTYQNWSLSWFVDKK
ncbi:MAG: hypothetical protein ACKOX6_14205 [Bdellovibrio sp.]